MLSEVARRREEYAASTRVALVDSATEQFATSGYAGTSLDQVVAQAQVTKGALYHHFAGKQALFEAVFERIEAEAAAAIAAAAQREEDPWQRALAGLHACLDVCRQPTYRSIVLQEGPVVLGFERWREPEARTSFGILRSIVDALLDDVDVDRSIAPTFTHVFFGAIQAAGVMVAGSDDPARASREVEIVITTILAGLRRLSDSDGGALGAVSKVNEPG